VLSKQEINSLKSYFSKTQINERLPYDRKNSIINRTCSFIGSTNMDEFLNDETGSVRWLCFRISSINWDYSANIDINRLWAQAHALAQDKTFECELTREDIAANEERNRDFQILSREKALIHKFLRTPANEKEAEFMNATDIELYLREKTADQKLTTIGIGKAMRGLGYERVKEDGVYGYFVAKRALIISTK
jgi:predicted P-loop ATPase